MITLKQVGTVNYKLMTVPEDYKCDHCNVHGVRLWRRYQSEVSRTNLFCADCAEENQKNCHQQGWQSEFAKGKGNQIGWYIPAYPVEGRHTYWGFTYVPEAAVTWWKNLPLRK